MTRYIAYLRKSTDEQNKQILSLVSQRRTMRDLAAAHGLSLVGILEESRTAKEPGRPIFNRILDQIEAGEADGLLCWDIDRLYRNPIDEGRVRWMLQHGVIKSIRTPQHEYGPQDAGLLMAIEGGRASDFIIRLKRNVARGVEDKLRSGAWPGQKPFGYIYDQKLRNIVPDRKHATILREMFELFSEGRHGMIGIAQWLAERGITTKSGKLWPKQMVYRVLTNKLYVGIMQWKGNVYEGNYTPIISPDLFSRVAAALKVRSKPRTKRSRHDFPFIGIFRCSCGSMLTAQWATGGSGIRYRYYRCTRNAGSCKERYVSEHDVLAQCAGFLARVEISPEEAEAARELVKARSVEEDRSAESAWDSINQQAIETQQHIDRLAHGYATGLIDEDSYTKMAAEFVLRKKSLKAKKERFQATSGNMWIELTLEAIKALELAGIQQRTPDAHATSHLVQKIGSNYQVSRKLVSMELAAPYDFVATLLAGRREGSETNSVSATFLPITSSLMGPLVDHLRTHFTRSGAVKHRRP